MPIYRFRCDRCGAETRLLSHFGVIYKGSGFYTTDYRRKKGGREGGSENKG